MSYSTPSYANPGSFTPGQSFLDAMRSTGVRAYDAGRWPQWRTWHIGAPGTSNFRFGNYEYVAPNDTSRANAKGTGKGSNLNRALYRYAGLKKLNPSLSDEEAWNQAVQWIIKHDQGKRGADYTGFRAVASSTPTAPAPQEGIPANYPDYSSRQPSGPAPSDVSNGPRPGYTDTPRTSPSAGGGNQSVANPPLPYQQPGGPTETRDDMATPPGWRYNPIDVGAENYGLALRNAFRQGGFNSGVDNPYFKFAQERLQGLAPFMDIARGGTGDTLSALEDMAKGYLGQAGGGSPLNYQQFVNMLRQVGQSGSDMQRAVLGAQNPATGGYDLPVQEQFKSLMNLVGGGAGLTMNPLLARALTAQMQAGYNQFQDQSFQDASRTNLINWLVQNNPTLRAMMGR